MEMGPIVYQYDQLIVLVAAWFHDTGFVISPHNHQLMVNTYLARSSIGN